MIESKANNAKRLRCKGVEIYLFDKTFHEFLVATKLRFGTGLICFDQMFFSFVFTSFFDKAKKKQEQE